MGLVYIIEDDAMMADCLALAVRSTAPQAEILPLADAVVAMDAIAERLPDMILLDVMLGGPDGFTLLNEMMSYYDTAQIPVVLVSSLDLSAQDLSHYGVVAVLDKATMTPDAISSLVQKYLVEVPHAK